MYSQFAGTPSKTLIALMTPEEISKEFSETYLNIKDNYSAPLDIERFIALVEYADKNKQREFAVQAICIMIKRNLYNDTNLIEKLTNIIKAPIANPVTTPMTVDELLALPTTSTTTASTPYPTAMSNQLLDPDDFFSELANTRATESKANTIVQVEENAAATSVSNIDPTPDDLLNFFSELSTVPVTESKADSVATIEENLDSSASPREQTANPSDILAPANELLQTYLNYPANHYIVTIVGILASIGADTAIKSSDGQPLLIKLMAYLSEAHVPIVTDILKNEKVITLKDNQEKGPLKFLLDTWQQNSLIHYKMMKLLIEAGEDPNTTVNLTNNNILHLALGSQYNYYTPQHNYYSVTPVLLSRIQELVKLGVNINARNTEGKTPLEVAMVNLKPQAILMGLIQAGANPNAKYLDGTPLLHILCLSNTNGGNTRFIEFLLKNSANPVDLSLTDVQNRTVLQALLDIPTLDLETIFLLLDYGVDPQQVNSAGLSLLHLLCLANNDHKYDEHITKLINTYKLKVDIQDKNGSTALALVLEKAPLPMPTIELLLKNGANPNTCNRNGVPLLHLLCHSNINGANEKWILKLVGQYNVNIDSLDAAGLTPLQNELNKNPISLKMIKFLLENNANPNVTNNAGVPLILVLEKNNVNGQCNDLILEVAEKPGVSCDVVLQHYMNRDKIDAQSFARMQELINMGASIETKNNKGCTFEQYLILNNQTNAKGQGLGTGPYSKYIDLLSLNIIGKGYLASREYLTHKLVVDESKKPNPGFFTTVRKP